MCDEEGEERGGEEGVGGEAVEEGSGEAVGEVGCCDGGGGGEGWDDREEEAGFFVGEDGVEGDVEEGWGEEGEGPGLSCADGEGGGKEEQDERTEEEAWERGREVPVPGARAPG